MKAIIIKYLNKNYRFTFATHANLLLLDRVRDEDVTVGSVMRSLEIIFSVSEKEVMIIFDEWAESQSILLNNRLVEMRERLYKDGFTLEPSSTERQEYIWDSDDRIPF